MKDNIRVNKNRIQRYIDRFSEFGKTVKNGVSRLALSEADKEARNYFVEQCKSIGLKIKVDDLGNIYATLEGKKDVAPIVIGSHLDSVNKGGRFDGTLGVIAGLEIINTLLDNNIKPDIPITIVNFTNEEGVRFKPAMMSSGVLSGKFSKDKVYQTLDSEGISFERALADIGYQGDQNNRLGNARAFLELHIEQGPVLENEKKSIGIVDCVVGMTCYDIEIKGESNHAGTTPMNMRKDALFIANDIIHSLRKQLDLLDSNLVYTIGRLDVSPNLHTIIPEKVSFTIEARHKNMEIIKKIEKLIKDIGKENGQETISITKLWDRSTVLFNEGLRNQIEKATTKLGYSNAVLSSGAGHDAQFIAEIIPTAMIFVPSKNGKSHSEDEFTTIEDCYQGINVLLNTVLQIMDKV